MTRWHITGAHKKTGEPISIGIVAQTSAEAVREANRKGIVVSGEPRRLDDDDSHLSTSTTAGIDYTRLERTIVRGVVKGLWWWIVTYMILVGAIVLLVYMAQYGIVTR